MPAYNRLLKLIATSLVSLWISSCSLTLDSQQGNIIDQASKQQVRVGLTQPEIIQLIGPPLLKHPLNDKIWAYVYQRNNSDNTVINQHLVLTFNQQGIVTNIKKHNLDKIAIETVID